MINKKKKWASSWFLGALICLCLNSTGFAAPILHSSQSVEIFAIGDMFDAVYSSTTLQDGTPVTGSLDATIWYKLTAFDDATATATFDVTVKNFGTSGQAGRVTSFGFEDVDPDATSANTTTTGWTALLNNGSPVNMEVCLTSGPNCNGGAGGGVLTGTQQVINLTIGYDPGTLLSGGLIFNSPRIRWQSVNGPSGTDLSAKLGGNLTLTAVPAPTSLLLFGTGLIGLVGIARRERLVKFFKGEISNR